jgi:predicted metal-dependent hydrolase
MSETETITTSVGQCSLRRSDRRTLEISVLPNGDVELVAPRHASVESILVKVRKRALWIGKQVRAFQEMNVSRSKLRYCGGATYRYLGRQYRLKVTNSHSVSVKLIGGYFHIATRTGAEDEIERLLSVWFRERAQEQFSKRLDGWREWCSEQKLSEPTLHLRSMPKRWGSTQKNGRIYLNPDVVRTPSICIDYVVTHEVCHLKHGEHNGAFYQLLDRLFPRWREIKHRLETSEL